jgi:hypothetical protein
MAQNIKERYQNPSVGDVIKLRLLTYNGNSLSNLNKIEKVDIFFLDENSVTSENPEGLVLKDSFDESSITQEDTGTYLLNLGTEDLKYSIGKYYDVWTVGVDPDQPPHAIKNKFEIYPNLWYSTPIPVVYDFNFRFQPNKMRKGSKQFIVIEILPNVPTAGDLRQYYENLAIVSDIRISMEQTECHGCVPLEQDLRLIIDNELVDYREKRYGYYKINTEDLECGIYDIWFKMDFGGNTYISDRYKFQIYD